MKDLKRKQIIKRRRRIVLGIIVLLFVLLLFLIRGLFGTVKQAVYEANITPTPYPTLYVRITPTPTVTPTISPTPGPVIVIDPGHGGTDIGTDLQGNADTVEKTINLEISKVLKDKLEALGFTVIMTRSTDTYVSVSDRIEIAKNAGIDSGISGLPTVFVSIHQNAASIDLTDVSGCEIYYNDSGNENNKTLAESVLKEVCESTGAKDRGVKTGDFDILSGNLDVPVILTECGFMTSDTEYELLKSDDYREKIAEGIVNGLLKYFKKATKTGN